VHLVGVATLPVGLARPTNGLGVSVSLAETARLAVGGRQTSHLSVFVDWVHDPLDVWVATDRLVVGIYADDLKELVRRVLTYPVAVKHAQSTTLAANTLLSKICMTIYNEVSHQHGYKMAKLCKLSFKTG